MRVLITLTSILEEVFDLNRRLNPRTPRDPRETKTQQSGMVFERFSVFPADHADGRGSREPGFPKVVTSLSLRVRGPIVRVFHVFLEIV